ALVVSVYLLYKKSLSPVVTSVAELQRHFDVKIQELEDKYDEEFVKQQTENRSRMNEFTVAVHERLNGFGERVKQNETDFEVINRQMATSQEDRRHLNEQLGEIRTSQQRIIELLLKGGRN